MTNTERHTKTEVELRAKECYKLRYETSPSITQEKWVEYCHENYNDRSEQQYCSYWAKAKDMYQEGWKERLDGLLGPAVDKITELLASEDSSDHKEAVKMIFKFTGNDIQKIQAEVRGEVKVNFGDNESL